MPFRLRLGTDAAWDWFAGVCVQKRGICQQHVEVNFEFLFIRKFVSFNRSSRWARTTDDERAGHQLVSVFAFFVIL